MALIDTIYKHGCGDFVIKFSKKNGKFEISVPAGIDSNGVSCYVDTYNQAKINIDTITQNFLSEKSFVKKHIFIQFKTSEGIRSQEEINGVKYKNDIDMLYDGIGFSIRWCIIGEYKVETPSQFGKLRNLYKILEASKNSRFHVSDRLNILPQIINDADIRQFDYTDELYNFLNSLVGRVEQLNSQLKTFFDKDPQKFLSNITEASHKLLM